MEWESAEKEWGVRWPIALLGVFRGLSIAVEPAEEGALNGRVEALLLGKLG